MSDITLRNYEGSQSPVFSFIMLNNLLYSEVIIENFILENINMVNQNLIFGTTVYRNFIMKNVLFRNITMNSGLTGVRIIGVLDFKLENATFDSISTVDPTDAKSTILRLNRIYLGSPLDINILDISYQNSNVSFIRFDTILFTTPVAKNIIFKNLEFKNLLISSPMSLLSTTGLEYDVGVVFSYNNLTFDSIEFTTKGYLMELSHQLPSNVTINSSTFTNIKSGSILIVSSNLQNTVLTTNVLINDSKIDNIGQESTSFIDVNEGGRLFISSCNFTNMYTLRDGSVISAGLK